MSVVLTWWGILMKSLGGRGLTHRVSIPSSLTRTVQFSNSVLRPNKYPYNTAMSWFWTVSVLVLINRNTKTIQLVVICYYLLLLLPRFIFLIIPNLWRVFSLFLLSDAAFLNANILFFRKQKTQGQILTPASPMWIISGFFSLTVNWTFAVCGLFYIQSRDKFFLLFYRPDNYLTNWKKKIDRLINNENNSCVQRYSGCVLIRTSLIQSPAPSIYMWTNA